MLQAEALDDDAALETIVMLWRGLCGVVAALASSFRAALGLGPSRGSARRRARSALEAAKDVTSHLDSNVMACVPHTQCTAHTVHLPLGALL